jgi:hypothetical protein
MTWFISPLVRASVSLRETSTAQRSSISKVISDNGARHASTTVGVASA